MGTFFFSLTLSFFPATNISPYSDHEKEKRQRPKEGRAETEQDGGAKEKARRNQGWEVDEESEKGGRF
jgi:hypothetical protein